MTPKEAMEVISQIQYKLEFNIDAVLCDAIHLSFKVKPSPGTRLLVNEDGNATVGTMRKVDITKLNELELLAVVYDMFSEFEVHECSEFFQYKGLKPFNSHDIRGDSSSDSLNIVAPRIKDIDLHYIQNHVRLNKEAQLNWNKASKKVYKLENMNLWDRIIFMFTGNANCPFSLE